MKRRVFVDTDIIYDLLGKRDPFYLASAQLFTWADEGKIQIYVSALSLANLHYLISKQRTENQAKEILRKFKVLVHVTPLNDKIIDLALNSEFADFEDAIQYYSALQNEIEVFLTRNLKDYKKAQITVLTAQDYINL
ncbi:MAG TPA: PIN domain-containing protein [Smithellaceae bacterium]|nr:PIN domain-containing protein [Bacteroidales bacterium]HNS56598.1 PIN domain-containing protein [Smithellaceae bacterium]HOX76780.1 PIN domain-containing protein [Bacteroidales bacterium]HPI86920.1 PIN domain-containing protein [Bacteroidales bacterium]HPM91536.1 PIN domain-containing protein [Bacteroidales bacterium]